MPYIDIAFYRAFTCDWDTPDETIITIIKRACDIVDEITQHRIPPFEKWNPPTQEQIKKAAAALTEFAVQNGGLDVLITGAATYGGNIRIGNFGYGDGRIKSDSATGTSDSRIPQSVFGYLLPTGLIDAGIGSVGCG